MTHRISDIDLKALREAFELNPRALFANESAACMAELQQSRALISQLRALAERMRERFADDDGYTISQEQLGKEVATREWLSELDSLLSAHGAQGDTSWYEGEVDREVVKEVIDLTSSQADAEGKS